MSPERYARVQNMVGQMDAERFGGCTNHFECEAACPKEISATFIAEMNRDYGHTLLHREVPTSARGGNGAWTGGSYGGVSYVDSFTNFFVNTVFVFSTNLGNGNAKPVTSAQEDAKSALIFIRPHLLDDEARRTCRLVVVAVSLLGASPTDLVAALGLAGSTAGLVQRRRHTLRITATRAESLGLKAVLVALAVLVISSLVLTVAARTPVSAEAKANSVSLDVKSFRFSPYQLRVKAGSMVKLAVKNDDSLLENGHNFATVGIENPAHNDGLEYTYRLVQALSGL